MPPGGSDFKPAWWCPGPHPQTILARFIRPVPASLAMRRVRVDTPDGDFIDLDFLDGVDGAPRVILLHGLEGSSEAPYMRSLLGVIARAGWGAVAVNFRGCSLEPPPGGVIPGRDLNRRKIPNRQPVAYHSGKTDDLDFVMNYLSRTAPCPVQFLTGFSIGGNIVLKWLGEKGESALAQVKRAAAISVPYDLGQSVVKMDRGFNRQVYTRALLRSLKEKICEKERQFPGIAPVERVLACRTFDAFDNLVTAPLHGFRDGSDYWSRSSSARYLERIRVPSLLIHAADDPFFPGNLIPEEIIRDSSFLSLVMPERGGHLGFVTGASPWNQDLWLEHQIFGYFKG